ncbi:hypothetical protein [Arcobacter sp. LA11]|uniref:hypothetical protein n=1 Tax=Arcobacter sp. LA11 TaxID=1898176 RepID=UPI0009325A9F|nr:hypothetical protein [Arcobacter sp. LA11]
MKYYERMNRYVRISNELFKEFEKIFKKEEECELVYLNNNNDKVNIKSKILEFLNIEGSEYMDTKEGTRIRLDKIVSLNGEDIKYLNHY